MKLLITLFSPEGSLQLWRTSAVKSSQAARATLPGRRGSAPSVSPVPSHWTDRFGRQRADALFPVPRWFSVYLRSCFFFWLLSQKYRHVDNIMFENHTIADRFLDFWRKTGSQRMGYLYGRFTEHKDIPLGIRAEVAAIYEPPQVNCLLPTWSRLLPVVCRWHRSTAGRCR